MHRHLILACLSALHLITSGQNASTSLYAGPSLPTGTVVPGTYTGHYRPQVHYSAPQGFMNDPNGLFIDSTGTYHMYYQYNPNATIAGNQHWGHTTSPDLYHWTNQPIAIFPLNSSEGVFTGSIVVDTNNTSGLFPNQTDGVIAIFTSATSIQSQALAYSFDEGYTFHRYAGNPVLDINSANFRDPKVFWHAQTSKWIMAITYAQEFTIGIYTSADLISWTHASNFTNQGLLGLQWECPNLVEIPMLGSSTPLWLMYISINPGAPLGGSIGQYYPGSFNGTHFTAVDNAARIADFGKDNYASQFFPGIPGSQHQLSIAWASNWQYTNYVPTGPLEGWQSAMTLPRTNYLANTSRLDYELVSLPYNLNAVMDSPPIARNGSLGNRTLLLDFDPNNAILLQVNITNLNTSQLFNTASLNFTFTSSISGESLSAGQFLGGDGQFWMNRGNTRAFENPFFTGEASTAVVVEDGWDGQVVLDRSLWEVFLLGGTRSATLGYFAEEALDILMVRCAGVNEGAEVSVGVWELDSVWAGEKDSTGAVGRGGSGNETRKRKRSKSDRVGTMLFGS